ncbi:MAG TPA: Npt1/Npt2 family nucleotide transporter [Labilithrix sp.]|nr:Npt1/Npt2 family nucleotide transporter [Labilithrix sp.]
MRRVAEPVCSPAIMPGTSPDGSSTSQTDERSPLERALGIVTEVKAGEGITALLLTLNVFLLLTAYYVIKPVREGLILAMNSGAEYKSYLSAAIAISLLVAVPAYARVASRVAKNKLVVGVTLFFAAHLAVFWMLSKLPAAEKNLGFVFFVWVGIFNMMVVAQFWAFANDLYSQEQGKRLFALVGIGASLGAALGAYVTNFLQHTLGLGVYELLIVSALLLVGCATLTQLAHAREHRAEAREPGHPFREAPPSKAKDTPPAEKERTGAFALVFQHKYLLLIAIFSLVFTFVNTNGEYMLSVLVKAQAKEAAAQLGIVGDEAVRTFTKSYGTTFYGTFFLWVNVIGVAVQTFAVSRIVKLGGLRLAFFILPVIALFDSVALLTLPALLAVSPLSVLRPGKIAENAADYSVNNTVRNMLWLPTSTEMKYKAKQAVDTFFVRMGDVASAALVYLGGSLFGWPVRNFAMVNAGLIVVWLVVARSIVRENQAMTNLELPNDDAKSGATA